jgi:hypothetical protein
MFAKTIVDSDAFLDMPVSSQNLYFHLSMRADDDGFLNNSKKIQKMVGASDDDLRILCAKSFIIPFESGVIVIKHWRINNYLRSDRYKSTIYQDELNQLEIKENGAYTVYHGIPTVNHGIPVVNQSDTNGIPRDTQVRLGKVRIGKGREERRENTVTANFSGHTEITEADFELPSSRFQKPTIAEVTAYCTERQNQVNPESWIDHYESNGWKVGKSKMVDWKAAVRTWEKSQFKNPAKSTEPAEEKLPEPRTCPQCGELENVQLTKYGQPWCHACYGWNFETQEALNGVAQSRS